MTPSDLAALRATMGLTQMQLAEVLGLKRYQTVLEWERGKRPIPVRVALMLQLLAKTPPV